MTGIVGGLSSQFGMVDEVTFGTPVTVTRFVEFNSESVSHTIERMASSGLRSGRRNLRTTQWVAGHENVSGDVEFEVQQQGMGLLFKHALGAISTAQPDATGSPTVYEHTAVVGQTDGKSFTFQIGRGDTGAVVRPFTYAGGKISQWDLSVGVDGLLILKATLDAISEDTSTALATASYATDSFPLSWIGGTITLPNSATGNVSKFDLSGNNNQDLSRWFMSGAGAATKKEQIESQLRTYSGTVDVEFEDLSAYSLFINGTVGELTAFFEGAAIDGTYNYALEVTLPAVRFDGVTPNVGGPGVITQSLPFTALDDGAGTGGVQFVYRTTDLTP